MDLVETERLTLRRVTDADAAFLVALLNDSGWLAGIGDRGVRDEAGARAYAHERLHAAHARHGFSMLAVIERASDRPVGLCGLIRRDTLDDVDLGYAFLPEGRGRGLAFEASEAVLERAHREHGLTRVIAITLPTNAPSVALLDRLGFRFEREFVDAGSGDALSLFGSDAAVAALPRTAATLAALETLAASSEREGYRFVRHLVDALASGTERFDAPGESLLGAWHGRALVGVCGLHADPYVLEGAAVLDGAASEAFPPPPSSVPAPATASGATTRPTESIGRLRHLYVHPAHRRGGLGSRLARRCLERAAGRFSAVRLRAADSRGAAFHAGLGFAPTRETDATHRLALSRLD